MENLTTEELVKVILDYISHNYSYNCADVFEDAITVELEDGNHIYINIGVDNGEIEG